MATPMYDLILIGGGTAELAAVSEALELGAERVALIERRSELGGECAMYACVPTKTLLTAARYIKLMKRNMPQYGLEDIRYNLNFKALMAKEQEIIEEGEYEFINDPRFERIGDRQIQGKAIFIATGSEPLIPPIQGLNETGYLSYQQATHLSDLPKSLLIIGGGAVGVEFAQLFTWLGVEVSLIQRDERLLPHEEPEISKAVEEMLTRDGIQVHTNCDVERIQRADSQTGAPLKRLTAACKGKALSLDAEEILLATGLKPRVEGLGLEEAGVEYTRKGIQVNAELQTTNPSVWAIGDVLGEYQLTHVADYHAVLAVQNALRQAHEKVDYRGLGWAVFTEPEVAHVGLTEAQAVKDGHAVRTICTPVKAVSRNRIESDTEGFIKLIIDKDNEQLLGGHLIGSGADEIAHTVMLAVRNHMTVRQALDMIYIYPSRSQLLQKALEAYVSVQRKQALPSQR